MIELLAFNIMAMTPILSSGNPTPVLIILFGIYLGVKGREKS